MLHVPTDATLSRLLARTKRDKRTGCLRWQGAKNLNGYGRVCIGGKVLLVHRVVCALAHGPIPDGHVVDHVHARGCRHVDCINPDHLEAVTTLENALRSSHPKMVVHVTGVCARGHRIAGENAKPDGDGRTRCRKCHTDKRHELHERRKASTGGRA